jgi:hypothetical protein
LRVEGVGSAHWGVEKSLGDSFAVEMLSPDPNVSFISREFDGNVFVFFQREGDASVTLDGLGKRLSSSGDRVKRRHERGGEEGTVAPYEYLHQG